MSDPYLAQLHKNVTDSQLVSLRMYADTNHIPIITEEGIRFLSQLVRIHQAKAILEIGTAIGYTSIYLAKHHDVQITTIERDIDMIIEATKNIGESGVSDNIKLIQDDALLVNPDTIGPFDLIFIDAAKAQSTNFFLKYKERLNPGGLIVADNLLFHGMRNQSNLSAQLRAMLRKIDEFNQFVLAQEEFDSAIYPIGDGMSVSIRKDVLR
jgi:predicted O-methyltransferase YrrM